MMIKEKEFICRICGCRYRMKARKSFYCNECGRKKRSMDVMLRRKREHPETVIGCGSGGNQQGEKNHNYKNGLSHYRDNFLKWNPDICQCEICGSVDYLVVHHVDQNRKNNKPENLMMLCRSCHAQVHGLAASLGVVPLVERKEDEP